MEHSAMLNEQVKVLDLEACVVPQPDQIISRTIFQDERVKAVAFGFGAGQELSEHTAARPAVMHFLSGEADVNLGGESLVATAGTWIHMAAGTPHGIVARTPTVMLLTLLKS
jgi:quercetin dioxygenase-like cupin family protein